MPASGVSVPIHATQNLVFVGGGHSHALVLRYWGQSPRPGVRLTLITDQPTTPYSGMLPGTVAGIYGPEEGQIDLVRLARFAGAALVVDAAVGLDLEARQVHCATHAPVPFDWLSLDIGSRPAALAVPGAAVYALPVKPVPSFLQAWQNLVNQVSAHPTQPLTLAIVGGGAGGVELALAIQARLQNLMRAPLALHLFQRQAHLVPSFNPRAQHRLRDILKQRNIQIHLQETVVEVLPTGVRCASGLALTADRVLWVTQASAPDWIAASGLATDPQGFVAVADTLQSLSHPQVFAAGDIATQMHHPRPKAGVFAVRHGRPLRENLWRALAGRPLITYHPQKTYLSLLGTGTGDAVAVWGQFAWQSPLVWWWKDWIDRGFMAQFQHLPVR
ncbi:MAG: FAD-dependent oxidoreductase [Gloeomargaritaceae cyanobacterium C42_A2020_066]|nr:FAD-dependent oxidoreductase [Gloeomargaritaceae cyanobacterium C42_A2020_066]